MAKKEAFVNVSVLFFNWLLACLSDGSILRMDDRGGRSRERSTRKFSVLRK